MSKSKIFPDRQLESDKVKMIIELDGLTIPQATALRSMFDRMKYLGSIGSSDWVSFYSDGDGNFRPKPVYTFDKHADIIKDWSEGACCWDNVLNQFMIDFDVLAWTMFP